MSDEHREQAWKVWWGDRGFNPAHHLAFNEGWDARNDEVEALKDENDLLLIDRQTLNHALSWSEEREDTKDRDIRALEAALRKARGALADWVCDQDGRYCFSHHRPWPCPEEGRDEATLAEIDAVLNEE